MGGGGCGDPLDADAELVADELRTGQISAAAAESLYGVVTSDGELDAGATEALRAGRREERRAWATSPNPDAPKSMKIGTDARRLGERLVLVETKDARYTACDCGHVFCAAGRNWKQFAARSALAASDLGPRVALHPELVAEGFACRDCGGMLATDIRWTEDAPLHDLELI